ncbi:MAG: alpha-amylase [Gammaproteobacteria bacterium]|nr:alpha-amylase [Gammaproteobacteria bacterium]|tara:strand:- start:6490 stop:8292 length:1803 start_codon:yes stop_codon:yes gene_type:complete
MADLNTRVGNHLQHIYPALSSADSQQLADALMATMRLDPAQVHAGRQQQIWDQRDVYLITYGDSIKPAAGGRPLHTLQQFMCQHLQGTVTGVHVLPFFPWSSDDGFAVSDYNTVHPALGDWQDIEALAGDFKLMADLVINHCSTSHTWFQQFIAGQEPGRQYFYTADPGLDLSAVTRPRTSELLRPVATAEGVRHVWCTFGHDQVDFDFRNPDVLLEFVRIIRLYLDHQVRVFRLDAVAFIWKEPGTNCLNLLQTHEIVRLLRALIEHAEPEALIITETNIPKRENLSYFGNANEAHSIYNFSLPPLLLFTLLNGNCRHLKNWLMSMPPAQLGTFYFNFIASHDGIGLRPAEGLLSEHEIEALLAGMERAGGRISWRATSALERRPYEINISLWDALASTLADQSATPDQWQLQRFICAHAILLALEGVPAFYIHSFLGTGNDEQRLAQSGHNRHINRHRWSQPALENLLADPDSRHAQILSALKSLIAIRQQQPAFHPNATQFTLHLGDGIFAFWRQSINREQSIFALNNISLETHHIPLSDINLIDTEDWYDLISGQHIALDTNEIVMAPYQTVWLSNRRPETSGNTTAGSNNRADDS